MAGLTADVLLVRQARDVVQKRGVEAGLEKEDPIVLPVLCPVAQSRTPIPPDLDLDLDLALQKRKGLSIC